MSTQKRKITYWGLEFLKGDEKFFDSSIFEGFMDYLNTVDPKRLLSRNDGQKKAISLESVEKVTLHKKNIYKVVFKSCKYNHSPDYMSSIDGSERPTDKDLTEGDKELTHMCFRIDQKEVYAIFESRKNGVTMGNVIYYLNGLLKDYIEQAEDLEDDFYIWASVIPSEGFLESLEKTQRITSVELYVGKKILGSEYLHLMNLDADTRNEVAIMVKSEPRKSLKRTNIRDTFLSMVSGGTELERIRLWGKDINNMSVILDSLDGKKIDEITVELRTNGVVDTYSIFSKMTELLVQQL